MSILFQVLQCALNEPPDFSLDFGESLVVSVRFTSTVLDTQQCAVNMGGDCADVLFTAQGTEPISPICHDGIWCLGEFCGRDGYLATGFAEMNHDCIVELLDFGLFQMDYLQTGPGLSGDFDGDDRPDMALVLRGPQREAVAVCFARDEGTWWIQLLENRTGDTSRAGALYVLTLPAGTIAYLHTEGGETVERTTEILTDALELGRWGGPAAATYWDGKRPVTHRRPARPRPDESPED